MFSESNICHIKNIALSLQRHEKRRFLLLAPTGISSVNRGGTNIDSDLGIKPGKKLFGLNSKSKAALGNRLSEMKFLITDELSILSGDLWKDTDARLEEMFMMIPIKPFAGFMAVGELLQLLLVRGKLILSQFSDKDSMKHLLGL